jgi:hypothetical protein
MTLHSTLSLPTTFSGRPLCSDDSAASSGCPSCEAVDAGSLACCRTGEKRPRRIRSKRRQGDLITSCRRSERDILRWMLSTPPRDCRAVLLKDARGVFVPDTRERRPCSQGCSAPAPAAAASGAGASASTFAGCECADGAATSPPKP